jgi:hypothetical protein
MNELLGCPFCGGAMVEVTAEDGHYWVHPGRRGIERADCWLADAWVSDEPAGEGSIGEWNTRAHAQRAPINRDELEQRCQEFLLNDNRKARNVVVAAHEFADFIVAEIDRTALTSTPAEPAQRALDAETIQTLLDLLNPLHGEIDRQTYDERYKQGFDAPADAEYNVDITARMERDLTQAVLILENRRSTLSSTDGGGK